MLGSVLAALPVVFPLGLLLFMAGVLPIPVGYERGKIKFIAWCGTGMHAHRVYWHGNPDGDQRVGGLQSIHPDDLSE